jgi:predicted nucleic acid-binding protein
MPADLFIDTNILVYAHDIEAAKKHDRAVVLVSEVWNESVLPWVSVQVLQELFVNFRRRGVELEPAIETVQDYARWNVVENTVSLLESSFDELSRWSLSYWDALILAAARHVGVTTIWSEDFSYTQDYDGIRVVNPLL